MNAKIHNALRAIVLTLFCVVVGLTAETNAQSSSIVPYSSIKQEQLTEHDGREAMHLAIENNSRFVAPPLVARVAGATVRTISSRNLGSNTAAAEHRAGLNFSSHNLKAVDDTRLYRLSPSSFRVRYIYSLRRIII